MVLAVLPKLTALIGSKAPQGIYRVYTDGRIEHVTGIKPKFHLDNF